MCILLVTRPGLSAVRHDPDLMSLLSRAASCQAWSGAVNCRNVQPLHHDGDRGRAASRVPLVRWRPRDLPPFDEIYPGRLAPVLRCNDAGGLMLERMTWGFPGPAATKGRPVTNVRNLASPFWRSALSNVERRCIVPVTRFCEWTAEPDPETKRKRKVWFGMHEDHDPLFAFAGLWRPGEGGPFMAFLTCEPNQTVGAIHPKAMPGG